MKKLTLILLLALLPLAAFANKPADQSGESESLDISSVIFGHVGDSY